MLSREQCRAADRVAIQRYGIPGVVLMENAGRHCVDELISFDSPADPSGDVISNRDVISKGVVILCGPGNNGGDGFVMARHLALAGWKVKVILFGRAESYSGDALTNLTSISRFRLPIIEFDPSWSESSIASEFSQVQRVPTGWVVDAMLGTGAMGDPRSAMARAIRAANGMEVRRMAIDIPSGLDCDTGCPSDTTFCADVTCTFIGLKIGFANPEAAKFLGRVRVVGIGAPVGGGPSAGS